MKRAWRIGVVLLALLALSACGKKENVPVNTAEPVEDTQRNAEEEYALFCEGKLFSDGLPQEELKRPGRVIGSLEDFVYAMDYLAFYRIGDAVCFEIDPAYAETFYNPYTVFQRAYQMADLADVYACQLEDSYYSQYGVVAVKYSMSRDIASEPPASVPDTPIVPSFDYARDGDPNCAIPLEESNKPAIRCENGEQLYYLAMNGYKPAPEPGSMAEELYERAKAVLRSAVNADMTEFQKIKAVYDYLTTEVYYDKQTAYSAETYLVREQAYYLEGVFMNQCAVCDGKAKAYALLLNMLDIPCYRTTGVNGDGDHAWNLVELEGKWYISCTTYGQSDATQTLGRILPNYSMLLAGRDTPYGEAWGYTPQKHAELYELLEDEGYDIFTAMSVDMPVSLAVNEMEGVAALLEEISGTHEPEYKIEFTYNGTDGEAFQSKMIEYLYALTNVNAVEIKSERGQVYQVIYLKES